MRVRRTLTALLSFVPIFLVAACTPGSYRSWLEAQPRVESVTVTELPGRKLGDPTSWSVVAVVRPDTSPEQMHDLVTAWPEREREDRSQLTLRRAGDTELAFTAYAEEATNAQRWDTFAWLHETWPQADLAMTSSAAAGDDVASGDRTRARVEVAECDPWRELERIDPVRAIGAELSTGLMFTCRAPVPATVTLTARSLTRADELPAIRARVDAVLAEVPRGTPWRAKADGAGQPLRVGMTTPVILDVPSRAVLADADATLTVTSGRSEVMVSDRVDFRAAARAAASLPWVNGVDATLQWVRVTGSSERVDDLVPVASAHPEAVWYLQDVDRNRWVRVPGAEFAERARQFTAVAAAPIDWGALHVLNDRGTPELQVEAPDATDWRAVASAVRAAGWAGEMRVVIARSYPGVEFTSTATGEARDVEIANNQRPPTRERHPELIEIVEAWDATAG